MTLQPTDREAILDSCRSTIIKLAKIDTKDRFAIWRDNGCSGPNKEAEKLSLLARMIAGEDDEKYKAILNKFDLPTETKPPADTVNNDLLDSFLNECKIQHQILEEINKTLTTEIEKSQSALSNAIEENKKKILSEIQRNEKENPNNTGGIPNFFWGLVVLLFSVAILTITPVGKRVTDHLLSPHNSTATAPKTVYTEALPTIDCPSNSSSKKICEDFKKITERSNEAIKRASDEINHLKLEVEKIGARLDDTYSTVEAVGLSAGIFGVLITIITIFFALKESERVKEAINKIANLEETLSKLEDTESKASEAKNEAQLALSHAREARRLSDDYIKTSLATVPATIQTEIEKKLPEKVNEAINQANITKKVETAIKQQDIDKKVIEAINAAKIDDKVKAAIAIQNDKFGLAKPLDIRLSPATKQEYDELIKILKSASEDQLKIQTVDNNPSTLKVVVEHPYPEQIIDYLEKEVKINTNIPESVTPNILQSPI